MNEDFAPMSSMFQISAAAAQGGRKYMEDRLDIKIVRNSNRELEFIFAAIYDGHGGTEASEYVRRNMFTNIVENQKFFSSDDNEVLEAVRDGFLRTHLNMKKDSERWPPTNSGYPCTAGTTATCIFIRNGKLYTGHVGDSSIVLANFLEEEKGYDDAKLTFDHKPENENERKRIEKAGGSIAAKSGIPRVIWKRPIRGHRGPIRRSTSTEDIPFLAVARSLGDFWSLNPDNNQYIVSPEPDVEVFRLKSSDNFIVIASDGLTNVVSIHSIIQTLRNVETKSNDLKTQPIFHGTINFDSKINYAHCLLQNAFKKWGALRADNISIVCVKLNANEIPPGHSTILADNINSDVCQQLIDYPFGVIQVNKNETMLLRANPVRHIYTGTLDKGVNFQQAIRSSNVNRKTAISNGQKTNQLNDEYFSGPGFILPEVPMDNNASLNFGTSSGTSISIYPNNGLDYFEWESDSEEGTHINVTSNSGIEFTSENIKQEFKKGSQIWKEKEEGPMLIVNNDKMDQPYNSVQKRIKPKSSPTSILRAGVKRRIEESDDGYNRYIPIGNGALPFPKKVCLHDASEANQLEQKDLKPPPPKRSRLQSVLNFFTSFFKW